MRLKMTTLNPASEKYSVEGSSADSTVCVCVLFSVVGPSEGPHGEAVARAGAQEEEAGEAKRGGQRDGERPDQETAGEIQLGLPDSLCKLDSLICKKETSLLWILFPLFFILCLNLIVTMT